jgi:hypothetical protein
MGLSFEVVEDMILIDSFQEGTKFRFKDNHQIIHFHEQKVFFPARYYWFKFLCRFRGISSIPVSASTTSISYSGHQKYKFKLQFLRSPDTDLTSNISTVRNA